MPASKELVKEVHEMLGEPLPTQLAGEVMGVQLRRVQVPCPEGGWMHILLERPLGRRYPKKKETITVSCPGGEEVRIKVPAGFRPRKITPIQKKTKVPEAEVVKEPEEAKPAPAKEEIVPAPAKMVKPEKKVALRLPSWAKWGIPVGIAGVALIVAIAKK